MSEVLTSITASALERLRSLNQVDPAFSNLPEPLVDSSLPFGIIEETFGIPPPSSAPQNSSIQLPTSSTEASQALPQSSNYTTSQSYAEIDRMLKEMEVLSGVILPAGTTTYLLECFDELRIAPSKAMIRLFVDGFRFAQSVSLYPKFEAAVSSLHDNDNQLRNSAERINESARNIEDRIDVMKMFNILKAELDAMIAKFESQLWPSQKQENLAVQEPLVDSSPTSGIIEETFGIPPPSSAPHKSSIQLPTSSAEANQALPQSSNYTTSQSYAEIDWMLKEVEVLSGVILPGGTTTYLLECFDELQIAPSKAMIRLFVDGFRFAQSAIEKFCREN
ncbi:hypothetical protein OWV82_007020 [Melia azedarach]|uniref:Uncharacterized protein n=1 Tax=Melia azedarach TaxID=155640 RepID=A0ACC1YIT6_MELAZ|nr:hypothetical protein OWV82_007020 [Melia azedarach]